MRVTLLLHSHSSLRYCKVTRVLHTAPPTVGCHAAKRFQYVCMCCCTPSSMTGTHLSKWAHSSGSEIIAFAVGQTGVQRHLLGCANNICALACSADGQLIVSGEAGKPGLIRLWEAASGKCLALLHGMHAVKAGCDCMLQLYTVGSACHCFRYAHCQSQAAHTYCFHSQFGGETGAFSSALQYTSDTWASC